MVSQKVLHELFKKLTVGFPKHPVLPRSNSSDLEIDLKEALQCQLRIQT